METEQTQTHMNDASVKRDIRAYTERRLELLTQQKNIKDDMKALAEEFNSYGVPCAVVNRCISELKREFKKTGTQKAEEEFLREWLLDDKTFVNKIDILNN